MLRARLSRGLHLTPVLTRATVGPGGSPVPTNSPQEPFPPPPNPQSTGPSKNRNKKNLFTPAAAIFPALIAYIISKLLAVKKLNLQLERGSVCPLHRVRFGSGPLARGVRRRMFLLNVLCRESGLFFQGIEGLEVDICESQ